MAARACLPLLVPRLLRVTNAEDELNTGAQSDGKVQCFIDVEPAMNVKFGQFRFEGAGSRL